MTKDELDAVEAWLTAARALLPTCQNPDALKARITEQEERRDAIEDSLSDQYAASNGLHVYHS